MARHAKPLNTQADQDRHDVAALRAKLVAKTPRHAGRLHDRAYSAAVGAAREQAAIRNRDEAIERAKRDLQ